MPTAFSKLFLTIYAFIFKQGSVVSYCVKYLNWEAKHLFFYFSNFQLLNNPKLKIKKKVWYLYSIDKRNGVLEKNIFFSQDTLLQIWLHSVCKNIPHGLPIKHTHIDWQADRTGKNSILVSILSGIFRNRFERRKHCQQVNLISLFNSLTAN